MIDTETGQDEQIAPVERDFGEEMERAVELMRETFVPAPPARRIGDGVLTDEEYGNMRQAEADCDKRLRELGLKSIDELPKEEIAGYEQRLNPVTDEERERRYKAAFKDLSPDNLPTPENFLNLLGGIVWEKGLYPDSISSVLPNGLNCTGSWHHARGADAYLSLIIWDPNADMANRVKNWAEFWIPPENLQDPTLQSECTIAMPDDSGRLYEVRYQRHSGSTENPSTTSAAGGAE